MRLTRSAASRVTTALGIGSGAPIYRYDSDHAGGDLRWTEKILDQPASCAAVTCPDAALTVGRGGAYH